MMKRKVIAAGAAALILGMASLPDSVVFASEDKDTAVEVKINESETDSTGKEDGKAKLKAAIEKWDALSQEKKNEVYKIIEEKQAVDEKLLDKFVSLGIMDSEHAKQIKADAKEGLSKLKESGKLPMGGKKPPKDGCKDNQNQQKQKQE